MHRRAVAMAGMLAVLMAPVATRAQAPSPAATPGPAQTRAQIARAENAEADRVDGKGGCFYINELQGNHALNDRSVIFRVNVSDFYRLDFADRCYELTYPEPKLILTPVGGIGLVCRAIDLDVKVGEQGPNSIAEPCIPSALHRMTPAEVAAVPKKDLP